MRTIFNLSAMTHYDIFKNKATKNLYCKSMKKILRFAQDDRKGTQDDSVGGSG